MEGDAGGRMMEEEKVCDECYGDEWVFHSKGGQGGEIKDCPKCVPKPIPQLTKKNNFNHLT